jgi:hypothetical protein
MHRRVEISDDAVLKIPTLLEIPISNQHSQGRVIPDLEQGARPRARGHEGGWTDEGGEAADEAARPPQHGSPLHSTTLPRTVSEGLGPAAVLRS